MLVDLVSRLAWVVAAGLDRSAEQRPGSNLGCAFGHTTDCGQNQRGRGMTMASPQSEEKMADHDISARVLISVRETEVL
jgi:hypothetical protein